jgi:outer membrane protein OmpA-like peptidoglycan-associated protein
MLGARVVIKRGSKEEGEKPFWISFSDLMSALMVLFLVVMSVALLAVTRKVSEEETARLERELEIRVFLVDLKKAASEKGYQGIEVDVDRRIIDFGTQALFNVGSYTLTERQAALLRSFVPEVLAKARDEPGKKWLKQIVVEGFTDQTGTYLLNLNLSLQRSQSVVCALFAPPLPAETPLTDGEKEQIRDLFLVGGYSFNSAKPTFALSRRVELRLEFKSIGENKAAPGVPPGNFGQC